jgi:hypothetical protein
MERYERIAVLGQRLAVNHAERVSMELELRRLVGLEEPS